MQAEVVKVRGGEVVLRQLRSGDQATVQEVFDGLGPESRLARFGGAKNVLTAAELDRFSRADGMHDVVVASVGAAAVGIARLARDPVDARLADVAVAVIDEWQSRGVGAALVGRLTANARAAGITHLRATIGEGNGASLALMHHVSTIERTPAAGSTRDRRPRGVGSHTLASVNRRMAGVQR